MKKRVLILILLVPNLLTLRGVAAEMATNSELKLVASALQPVLVKQDPKRGNMAAPLQTAVAFITIAPQKLPKKSLARVSISIVEHLTNQEHFGLLAVKSDIEKPCTTTSGRRNV